MNIPAEVSARIDVINDVLVERDKQDAKWGEQNHPNGTGPRILPMPYGSGSWSAGMAAERLTLLTNCAAKIEKVTWLHILREEVFEAFAEDDPTKLRTELIQVAAVAVQWAEAIDRAEATQPTPACGEHFVFWPDDESIDVSCELPEDHEGLHEDGGMEWGDDD